MESFNNVEKTLIHISHLHPLKLVASPEPKPICHACNMLCADQSYGCIHCHYFLHITCATTVRSMHHPSHPYHTLNLELTPAYPSGQYGCDGCGVDGSSFCLRCRECGYDLHLPCAAIPHEINHHSHHHPLMLVYKNPYPSSVVGYLTCDLCKKYLDVNRWFYLCRSCDFGGHVGCLSPQRIEVLSPGLQSSQAPPPPQPQPHEAAQLEMMRLQGELRTANAMANIMRQAGRNAVALTSDNIVYYERPWI